MACDREDSSLFTVDCVVRSEKPRSMVFSSSSADLTATSESPWNCTTPFLSSIVFTSAFSFSKS